jgi:MFS family permease
MITTLLVAIAFLFTGPSTMLNFPNTLGVMIVGHVILGLVTPCLVIPALPEMTDYSIPFYSESQREHVNHYSAGIFTAFLGLGFFLGPLYGTIVTSLFNFRWAMDLFAIIILIFGLLYFIMADGIGACKQSLRKKKTD